MIILPALEKIVLGPPKCATTTLHYELVRPPWCGFQLDPRAQHDFLIPDDYLHFQIVGPVRDPYERAVSLFWHYLRDVRRERGLAEGLKSPKQWGHIPIPHKEIPFTKFMQMVLNGRMEHIERPSYAFFVNTVNEWLDRAERVDVTLPIEDLEANWAHITGTQANTFAFATKNAPGRKPWSEYKTAEAIEMVDAWAEEDFERYGYAHQTC